MQLGAAWIEKGSDVRRCVCIHTSQAEPYEMALRGQRRLYAVLQALGGGHIRGAEGEYAELDGDGDAIGRDCVVIGAVSAAVPSGLIVRGGFFACRWDPSAQCFYGRLMQTAVSSLASELARLQKENEMLRAENARLREKVAVLTQPLNELKRLVFGVKSERFVSEGDGAQGAPFEADLPPPVAVPTVPVLRKRPLAKRAPVRQVLPAHLPREVITLEPEEDVSRLKRIGVEVTETLDYVPGTLRVMRRERPKYVDPDKEDRGVIMAPLPARLIDKGMAEPGLLAHVLIGKYIDHLPV